MNLAIGSLPSHGWGRRFNPCIAHHFPRLSAALFIIRRAQPRTTAQGYVAQIWHSLFPKRSSPSPSLIRADAAFQIATAIRLQGEENGNADCH